MASLTTISMATTPTMRTLQNKATSTFFNPLPIQRGSITMIQNHPNVRSMKVHASLKEKSVIITGLTSTALTASMMVPQVAEAAELVPSLKNFLLSIAAGGAVLGAILGAIIAVSNFDPVKRA